MNQIYIGASIEFKVLCVAPCSLEAQGGLCLVNRYQWAWVQIVIHWAASFNFNRNSLIKYLAAINFRIISHYVELSGVIGQVAS